MGANYKHQLNIFQENPDIVATKGEHNHLADEEVTKRKTKRKLKELSTNIGKQTRTCVAEAVMGMDDDEMESLPKVESMKRLVQRARRDEGLPKAPEARTGFEIEGKFAEYCESPFLRHDSGSDDEKRILIFVTDEGISDLDTFKNWSGDGTFKSSPLIFYQIFLLHVHINSTQTVPR